MQLLCNYCKKKGHKEADCCQKMNHGDARVAGATVSDTQEAPLASPGAGSSVTGSVQQGGGSDSASVGKLSSATSYRGSSSSAPAGPQRIRGITIQEDDEDYDDTQWIFGVRAFDLSEMGALKCDIASKGGVLRRVAAA